MKSIWKCKHKHNEDRTWIFQSALSDENREGSINYIQESEGPLFGKEGEGREEEGGNLWTMKKRNSWILLEMVLFWDKLATFHNPHGNCGSKSEPYLAIDLD